MSKRGALLGNLTPNSSNRSPCRNFLFSEWLCTDRNLAKRLLQSGDAFMVFVSREVDILNVLDVLVAETKTIGTCFGLGLVHCCTP